MIHFAANSLVGVSMKEPLEYFDNNVYGTLVLLETMKKFNVKHIVFFFDGGDVWRTEADPDRGIGRDRTDQSIWRNQTDDGKDDEMVRSGIWDEVCGAALL